MRTILVAGALLLSAAAKSQTTEQEFNYINTGLTEDLKTGRDIKAGYQLVSTGVDATNKGEDGVSRKVEIFYFRAKAGNKNKALVLKCSDSGNGLRYMCLPAPTSVRDIHERAWAAFKDAGQEWHLSFFWAFAQLSVKKLL